MGLTTALSLPLALGACAAPAISDASSNDASSGGRDQSAPTLSPPDSSPQESGKPVIYASSTDMAPRALDLDAAVDEVLDGLDGKTSIQGVDGTFNPRGLELTVMLDRNNGVVPDMWMSSLVVGAIGELTRVGQAAINAVVTSATLSEPADNGTISTSPLSIGAVSLGQEFGSPGDAELLSRVDQVAAEYGLEVIEAEVFHPLESALRVKFVVPEPGKPDWTVSQLRAALVGTSPCVEGILIEVDSPDGRALLQSAAAYRTGLGTLWFAPGEDVRFGALHGGLAGAP